MSIKSFVFLFSLNGVIYSFPCYEAYISNMSIVPISFLKQISRILKLANFLSVIFIMSYFQALLRFLLNYSYFNFSQTFRSGGKFVNLISFSVCILCDIYLLFLLLFFNLYNLIFWWNHLSMSGPLVSLSLSLPMSLSRTSLWETRKFLLLLFLFLLLT